jgi:hypothetical protein
MKDIILCRGKEARLKKERRFLGDNFRKKKDEHFRKKKRENF